MSITPKERKQTGERGLNKQRQNKTQQSSVGGQQERVSWGRRDERETVSVMIIRVM